MIKRAARYPRLPPVNPRHENRDGSISIATVSASAGMSIASFMQFDRLIFLPQEPGFCTRRITTTQQDIAGIPKLAAMLTSAAGYDTRSIPRLRTR